MTAPTEDAFPVSAWLDARGRFNLVSLVLFMPALMYLKLRGLGQGTIQELAGFNRTVLGAIAAAWLICLIWDQLALAQRGKLRRQALPRLGRYLNHNFPGLILSLMFLADLAWWPIYLGVLMLLFALRGLRQPRPVDVRPVGPLVKTTPMPAFKRRYVLLSALSWIALLGLGVAYQGRNPGVDRDAELAKARLQRLQALLESYRAEFRHYPDSLSKLRTTKPSDLSEWDTLKNPYDGQGGYAHAYLDYAAYQRDYRPVSNKAWQAESILGIYLDLKSAQARAQIQPMAGLALYQYLSPDQYWLYATDLNGELIKDHDEALSLQP